MRSGADRAENHPLKAIPHSPPRNRAGIGMAVAAELSGRSDGRQPGEWIGFHK